MLEVKSLLNITDAYLQQSAIIYIYIYIYIKQEQPFQADHFRFQLSPSVLYSGVACVDCLCVNRAEVDTLDQVWRKEVAKCRKFLTICKH